MTGGWHQHPAAQASTIGHESLASTYRQVIDVLRTAALALDRYQAWHGVHGAICPETVVIAADNNVTILPPSCASSAHMRAYWSPQRRAGETPRVSDDLYALGVLANQWLADAELPVPDDAPDVARRRAGVEATIRTLTSWSPSERPASGAEVVQLLDALIGAATAEPRQDPRDRPAGPAVEPSWAAAMRVAQARRAHRLAQATPPRPARPPRPRQVRAPLGKGHYPDMPLPAGWVAVLVLVLCSVYLLPLYFMLFPSS
jgi:hypothetical protein